MLSRREFIGTLAAAVPRTRAPECRLIDLGAGCVLRESLEGFHGMGIPACEELHGQESGLHLIAGAGALPDGLMRGLSQSRGWILFESAAGFGGFETQRQQLAEHFGIEIGRPLDLGQERVPYIDYRWPVAVKIRDFDRIVPVRAAAHDVIASIAGQPVAVRRGRFIFLGSPIGPALLAGDREAHRWFDELRQRTFFTSQDRAGRNARATFSAN